MVLAPLMFRQFLATLYGTMPSSVTSTCFQASSRSASQKSASQKPAAQGMIALGWTIACLVPLATTLAATVAPTPAQAAALTSPTIVRFDDYPGNLASPVGIGELQGNEYQQYGISLENWYQYRDPNDQADGLGISLGQEPVQGLDPTIGVIRFAQPVRNLSFQWWTIWDGATQAQVDDPALRMSVAAFNANGVQLDFLQNLVNHQIVNNTLVYSLSTSQLQGDAIASLRVSGYIGYSQITTLQFDPNRSVPPIPSPALLPGLISMAIATWRRRKKLTPEKN
jgi:hypothetical protein